MELEIRPEPSPEEREAIEAALEAALAARERGEPGRGRWWEAGLPAEEDEPEEG